MAGDVLTMASHWPLVVIVFEDEFTEEAVFRCMDENEELLKRGPRFVTVRDGRMVKRPPPATVRRKMADWQTRNEELIRTRCIGVANIIASPIARAGLQAIHWISTPPTPEVVVPTLAEGVEWAMKRLAEEDILVPDDVQRFAQTLLRTA